MHEIIPVFYSDVIKKAKRWDSDTSKCVKSLTNRIHKGYDLTTMVHSLIHGYFVKNVDNLLAQPQPVDPTSNSFSIVTSCTVN